MVEDVAPAQVEIDIANPITFNDEEIKLKVAAGDLEVFVRERWTEASDDRKATERKWLDSTRAWRGEYSPEEKQKLAAIEARSPGNSQVFIKFTKTKVQASYGQLIEVLFGSNKFPISVEPTPIPDGAPDKIFLEQEGGPLSGPTESDPSVGDAIGFAGDGQEIEPGATQDKLLGGLLKKLNPFTSGKTIHEGPSPDKTQLMQFSPALEAAMNMEKVMQDQLTESRAEFALRKTVFETVMLGTGVIKGPFNFVDVVHKYDQNPETKEITYTPENKLVPSFRHVSAWNFYPDPDARSLEDADYVIERHLLTRHKLRELKRMEFFDADAINRVLALEPTYVNEYWEGDITDSDREINRKRYEILEYWGYLDEGLATRLAIDLSDLEDEDGEIVDNIQVNVWITNGEILRVVLNPFTPLRLPYHAVPYEEHPYQIWGIGVPENMADTQALMNGHIRMAIDNLRFAGNVVFEVNENQLAPGQDLSVYPGKVFRKQGGAPGQSIFGIKFPDTSQSHTIMFDKARQLADEATGIPSFSHGSTNVTGVTRTAAGISMLMGAAALTTKTVIRNLDHFLINPLGQTLFQWNMQFNEDNIDIRGDYNIVAGGTTTLMQREVQSQRILSFLQVGSASPITAPLINAEYLIKELAKSMDLDPEKAVNDPKTAALYAELIQLQGAQNANTQGGGQAAGGAQGPGGGAGPEPATGGVDPSDATGAGGGNIGVGGVPQPGENSFSAGA